MANNARTTWNKVRKIYGEGICSMPMVGREHTYLFYWLLNLDKVTQNYMKASLQFQYKQQYEDYKNTKTRDEAKTKYHVICL